MSRLIEKEGRYYKECSVVMLPTENKSLFAKCIKDNVYADKVGELVITGKDTTLYKSNEIFQYQEIYITSDDEIKEDEEVYVFDPLIVKVFKINTLIGLPNKVYKIIATTDKSLTYATVTNNGGNEEYCDINHTIHNLSQIPQDFIKLFCEKGGIDKVLVEYEKHIDQHPDWRPSYNDPDNSSLATIKFYLLKTGSHNTITIKPIKDSWTREEVEKLLKKGIFEIYQIQESHKELFNFQLDNWIKENL